MIQANTKIAIVIKGRMTHCKVADMKRAMTVLAFADNGCLRRAHVEIVRRAGVGGLDSVSRSLLFSLRSDSQFLTLTVAAFVAAAVPLRGDSRVARCSRREWDRNTKPCRDLSDAFIWSAEGC